MPLYSTFESKGKMMMKVNPPELITGTNVKMNMKREFDMEDCSRSSKRMKSDQELHFENGDTKKKPNGQPPRNSISTTANSALKEAKDLKHMADRLYKNCGSTESIWLYFQAALKFLSGASLLETETGTSEATKHNEFLHIYSSTAKLCEFCGHEYEKAKDMGGASLAYKCVEVAYMRVVYSSHTNATTDHQAALQIAQDVMFAMEASKKSRSAFAAATSLHKESLKKALDYNFQDIEGLLRLVKIAMDAITP